jgi:GNAT superfamily N-acetyltransferase
LIQTQTSEDVVGRIAIDKGYCAVTASKDLLELHKQELTRIHNQIPGRIWNLEKLTASKDEEREFVDKGRLSGILFRDEGEAIGLCIAFRRWRDADGVARPSVYMHRLAIDKPYRGRGLGAIFHALMLMNAFLETHRTYGIPFSEIVVSGQMRKCDSVTPLAQFYADCGYHMEREILRADGVDLLMSLSWSSFKASRHYVLAGIEARIPESLSEASAK